MVVPSMVNAMQLLARVRGPIVPVVRVFRLGSVQQSTSRERRSIDLRCMGGGDSKRQWNRRCALGCVHRTEAGTLHRNEGDTRLRGHGGRRLQDAGRQATAEEQEEVSTVGDGERGKEEEHGTVLMLNCMEIRCAEVHETFVEACLEHFRVWRLPTTACPPHFQHPRIVIYAMLLRPDRS
jgi:hypothetical protein